MPRRETIQVVVNDDTIAAGDYGAVVEPVWWSADIYHGPGVYEQSLKRFTQSQRFVFAVLWYRAEVNNGGHRQFYSNSTGIVWKDAIAGLNALGIPKAAAILQTSADRLGGNPSLDRQEREDQMEQHQPDFEDCDNALYQLQKQVDIDAKIMDFIKSHPSDFHFSGTIERVVLP